MREIVLSIPTLEAQQNLEIEVLTNDEKMIKALEGE